MEHPEITQINRTGYPSMVEQSEHTGVDYFGTELLAGDDIVEDPATGEVVLKEDLEKYLKEVYEFKFSQAE
ncbi:hypothetical protein BEH_11585 [Priestia filamentosa]|uniref:Uncharacterized protein n=1 Tax=Priestia filamentosa TaxID=1402861 RepID=A0A0H4KWI6_9BACI|nr:hypothetical protein [Priestia filamentosa]AKO92678.1 hypothetical protein BEH_11585 [Priestia filamentosa]